MASVRLKINLYIQICLKVRIFLFKMMLWLFYFLLNLYMIDQEIFFNPFFFRMKGGGFFFRILPILITLIDGCLKKKKITELKAQFSCILVNDKIIQNQLARLGVLKDKRNRMLIRVKREGTSIPFLKLQYHWDNSRLLLRYSFFA